MLQIYQSFDLEQWCGTAGYCWCVVISKKMIFWLGSSTRIGIPVKSSIYIHNNIIIMQNSNFMWLHLKVTVSSHNYILVGWHLIHVGVGFLYYNNVFLITHLKMFFILETMWKYNFFAGVCGQILFLMIILQGCICKLQFFNDNAVWDSNLSVG